MAMHILIATASPQHAALLATQLRIPRGMWSWTTGPESVMAARATLVLVDNRTVVDHEHADELLIALHQTQVTGRLVVATLDFTPLTDIRQ